MVAPTFMAAYVLVAVLNVIAEATDNVNGMQLTKPLLMPLLLGWLIAFVLTAPLSPSPEDGSTGPRWPVPLRWLAAGLVFAWAGDLLLMGDGDLYFTLGLAAFLVMQVCYLIAFLRQPGPGLVRAWKVALIPYVLLWIVLNVVISSGVGDMRIPVLVYSAVLLAMAVAALDLVLRMPQRLAWRTAAGALLFVVSDALIALVAFGPLTDSVRTGAAVMASYTAAQGLIVTGFARGVLDRRTRAALDVARSEGDVVRER